MVWDWFTILFWHYRLLISGENYVRMPWQGNTKINCFRMCDADGFGWWRIRPAIESKHVVEQWAAALICSMTHALQHIPTYVMTRNAHIITTRHASNQISLFDAMNKKKTHISHSSYWFRHNVLMKHSARHFSSSQRAKKNSKYYNMFQLSNNSNSILLITTCTPTSRKNANLILMVDESQRLVQVKNSLHT